MEIHEGALNFFSGISSGPKITLWTDNRYGASMYLGCRQSDLYFRAYNKAAESNQDCWQGCVRLELEVKGCLPKSIIKYCLASDTVQAGVLSQLRMYCENRGISTNFLLGAPRSFYERPTIATDELKSLEWLSMAVRPSVERLLDRGLYNQVSDALGLTEFSPKCKPICDNL